jgi:tRNA threonylcarbamoyladenosine biosynthesis protein TsaE
MTTRYVFLSSSARETQVCAGRLARILKPGDILGLTGPLGSGKTTFVQGLARGLDCREAPSSPTFVLAQTYHGRVKLHHLDFYRLKESEILGIGLEDFYSDRAVSAVEWIERAPHLLPPERVEIVFRYKSQGTRRIDFVPHGKSWVQRLKKLPLPMRVGGTTGVVPHWDGRRGGCRRGGVRGKRRV